MKTVVFGVFDLLHEGHLAFLQQAAAIGHDVHVILARDETTKELKGKLPVQSFAQRRAQLADLNTVTQIHAGDKEIGAYKALQAIHPDIIFLGYDQSKLAKHLAAFLQENTMAIPIKTAESHEPERFKTTLLREQL